MSLRKQNKALKKELKRVKRELAKHRIGNHRRRLDNLDEFAMAVHERISRLEKEMINIRREKRNEMPIEMQLDDIFFDLNTIFNMLGMNPTSTGSESYESDHVTYRSKPKSSTYEWSDSCLFE